MADQDPRPVTLWTERDISLLMGIAYRSDPDDWDDDRVKMVILKSREVVEPVGDGQLVIHPYKIVKYQG